VTEKDDKPGKRVFVYSGYLGQGAGAYLATFLLCKHLGDMGHSVTCFAHTFKWGHKAPVLNFKVAKPFITFDRLWGLHERLLTGKMLRLVHKEKPDYVFVLGVTPQAHYLLQSNIADQLIIWELTNANIGNKWVDAGAVKLLNRCRALLSPSGIIDENLRTNYNYKGKILRLPFWIEEWKKPSLTKQSEFLADFIYLGRRDEEKGLRELVRATAIVASEFPAFRVIIAGLGTAEPFLKLAQEMEVASNIRFEFFEDREAVLTALAASRALILPSYHEGYPLVLLEAAQSGVPFIATTVGSILEIFEDNMAALLCPPKDDQALAKAMLALLNESETVYLERRHAALQAFQELSSESVITKSLHEVLENI
jgi:glycosyltransferase involved in cell wall biosynthesis